MRRTTLVVLDRTVFRAAFGVVSLLAKLGRASARDLPELPPRPRFAVIRPGGLGDALMAVPTLRALREAHPQGHITVVCVRKNASVIRPLPFVDEVMVMDELPRLLAHLWRLRRGRYDVLFDLEPFRRTSSVVAFLTGVAVRVGFDTNSRRRLYSHIVSYAHDRRPEAENMLRQLRVVGIEAATEDTTGTTYPIPERALEAADALFREIAVDPERETVVAVAPGVLKTHHRWVMSEFATLIGRMLDEDPRVRVLLVGVGADRPDVDEVLAHLGPRERVHDVVGRTSVMEMIAVLRSCRILVACDGGMIHMAAAAGCATVSLWGPGVMDRFKPPGEAHVGIRKNFPCVPCVTWDRLGTFPPCPYGRRCYNEMTADDVFHDYLALKARVVREPVGDGARRGASVQSPT